MADYLKEMAFIENNLDELESFYSANLTVERRRDNITVLVLDGAFNAEVMYCDTRNGRYRLVIYAPGLWIYDVEHLIRNRMAEEERTPKQSAVANYKRIFTGEDKLETVNNFIGITHPIIPLFYWVGRAFSFIKGKVTK
ncbi:MAG: hypothetical protein ACC707_01675 [Thiohalomonadales bacterium]